MKSLQLILILCILDILSFKLQIYILCFRSFTFYICRCLFKKLLTFECLWEKNVLLPIQLKGQEWKEVKISLRRLCSLDGLELNKLFIKTNLISLKMLKEVIHPHTFIFQELF